MIFTDPITTRPRGLTLEDYGTSVQDFLAASAEDAFIRGPLSSIFRAVRDRDPNADTPSFVPGLQQYLNPPNDKLAPLVSAEDANERAKHLGLKFDRPVREKRLQNLMDRKTAEVSRQAIFRQAENQRTFGLGFMTSLLASAADPIQLAASFVPVVGAAKWAALAARVGKLPARGAVGLVEGAVGSTLVEPIVLGQAIFEQGDYGLYDSLINVAFGTVLGGGLHVAFGGVGEAVGRVSARAGRKLKNIDQAIDRQQGRVPLSERIDMASPQTREAALRMTLAELNAGRAARAADDFLALDPSYRATAQAADLRGSTSTVALNARASADQTIQFDIRGVPTEGGIVPHQMSRSEYVAVMSAKETDQVQVRAEIDAKDRAIAKLQNEIETNRNKAGNKSRREALARLRQERDRLSKTRDLQPGAVERAQRQKFAEEHRLAVSRALDAGEALPERILVDHPFQHQRALGEGLILPEPEFDASRAARRFQDNVDNPENIEIADFEAARRARDEVELREAEANPERAQALADEQELRLNELADGLGIERKEVTAMLKEADDEIAAAKERSKAVKAAAACETRKAQVA